MKNKKAQVLDSLGPLAITLLAVGITIVIGLLIMGEVKDNLIGTQTFCPALFTLNSTVEGQYICCNSTAGGAEYTDCGTGNTTAFRGTFAWNGTGATQEAVGDIPGWLPIIVITVIGGLLIGLVAIFRK